ncbi:MAG: SufD family Fe-S cluster assembly protein [Helicobacteraceae bacterium]|nr:SufD family Fe-S cluster assembly protein [Candidatus Sulfurimonas ponti]
MDTLALIDTTHPLYSNFDALGVPNTKTEQYKNFPIKPILAREYSYNTESNLTPNAGTNLVMHNGMLLEYPEEIDIKFNEEFHTDKEHFDSLYFMSHMLSTTVITLKVHKDCSFEIQHTLCEQDSLTAYRIALEVDENIHVEVFESFQTDKSSQAFTLYGLDVHVSNNSTLRWIRNENRADKETEVVGSHKFNVAKQATLVLHSFDFGSASSLHLYKIDLAQYASCNASHLLLSDKDARRGNVVHINHNEAHAKSTQEARSILKDNATGIFDAKILVAHDAKYASASQNSKAILLDEHAHMYAKPQLEIYTDELEASHGSTIGTLDEDALFYLLSRGISMQESRKMLVSAFANTLIDNIPNQEYATKIHKEFENSL